MLPHKELAPLLNPDPVAHARSLMEKGQLGEALAFSTTVSKSLGKVVAGLNKIRMKVHAELFEQAVKAGDMTTARREYWQVQMLAGVAALPDPTVEERYIRAMSAARMKPIPVKRKFRHMTLVEQLRSVFDLTGDVVECGCFRGLSSWMICATLHEEAGGFDGRGFHIFDSFAGLSNPVAADLPAPTHADQSRLNDMMQPGGFACSEAAVRQNLSAFHGITYHPGWLPDSLKCEAERSYRFIHVDVDLYEPTLGVLEYFYPRLVPGGLILTDDYGWPGARQAFDEFCARHDLQVEELADNQAVLRK
jgi:O-methyltransferase